MAGEAGRLVAGDRRQRRRAAPRAGQRAALLPPTSGSPRRWTAAQLVAVYRHFYPLFQQAYVELGYPQGYFNDRLVAAIDDLLATPEPAEPPRLVQQKVIYQFADSDLEGRSAGQKIMLRIGTENARTVKAKLREIRKLVAKP